MRVKIEVASSKHIALISNYVRQADIDEFHALSLSTPEEVMRISINVSSMAWVGFVDDNPVAMFGVAPRTLISKRGIVWLVGTTYLDKYRKTFLKHCPEFIELMQKQYPLLENYVDARNVKAQAWLKYLGFDIGESIPFGILGYPFKYFSKRLNHV